MASPTELAREALKHSEALKPDFELLEQLVELHDLPGIRTLLIKIESRVVTFEKYQADIQRIGTLKVRVEKLEKRGEEVDKRGWQFVYIAAGAGLALVSSFAVQLVFFLLKK